jgi:hypothetical protein
VPDDDARIRIERRERHPVVVAILEDGGIGAIAGEHGVQETAVAEVGDALAFEAFAPAEVRPVAVRLGRAGGGGFDFLLLRAGWRGCETGMRRGDGSREHQ